MANEGQPQSDKKVITISYEVLVDCFGFPPIGGESKENRAEGRRQDGVPDSYYTRLWRKGEKISLPSNIVVPKHFHDLRKPTPAQERAKRKAINSRKVRRITRADQ